MPLFSPISVGGGFALTPANNYDTSYFFSSTSFTVSSQKVVDIVLVGGGGGGRNNTSGSGTGNGGGGGAGAVTELSSVTLNRGTTYTITIGAGGAGNASGGTTQITNITNAKAIGGGRGGFIDGSGSANSASGGGSGGGGSILGPWTAQRGFAENDPAGYTYGNDGVNSSYGGGGGGAGGAPSGATGGASRTNWAGTFSKGGDSNTTSNTQGFTSILFGSGGIGGGMTSTWNAGNPGLVAIRYSLV